MAHRADVGKRARRLAQLSLLLGTAVLTSTCGLEAITSPAEPFSFSLEADTSLVIGASRALVPTSTDPAAFAGVQWRWRSASPTVVRVDTLTGEITALAEGRSVVSVTAYAPDLPPEGVTAQLPIVTRYAAILIAPVDSLTGLGQSFTPQISGLDAAGVPVSPVNASTTGSDTTVLRQVGTVYLARRNGTATITATYAGLTAQRVVKVRRVAKSVTFPITTLTLTALQRDTTVTATVRDTRDSIIANAALTWQSLDTAALSVASDGAIRAKRRSAASLRVLIDTVARSLPTAVVQVPAALVKVSGDGQTGGVGSTLPLPPTIEVRDAGAAVIPGAAVLFVVGSGNGTVQTPNAVADSLGRASAGGWTMGTTAGTQQAQATLGTLSQVFVATASAGPATQVNLGAPPTSASAGVVLAPVTATLRDQFGNVATGSSAAVTLTISAGALAGTTTRNAVNGVATFDDITVTRAVTQARLGAQSTGVTASALSAPFNVLGVPFRLRFVTQPSNVVAAALIAPTVVVAVEDSVGNALPSASLPVTMSLGTNTPGDTLRGTLTATSASGLAGFADLRLRRASTGYTLVAASTGLVSATSTAFSVIAGSAASLEFLTQPVATNRGVVMAPAPQVRVTDSLGNAVTSAATVTLAIGANPGGSILGGTTTANTSAGIATFPNITLSEIGAGYTLVATSGGLTAATSTPFTIAGPGTKRAVEFGVQPAGATAGSNLSAFTVRIVDSVGVTVSSATDAITVTLAPNGEGATALGTTTTGVVGGVATFSAVRVQTAGTGFRLIASATGLAADTSAVFAITPSAAARLGFVTEPQAVVAGTAIAPAVQVGVQDAYGNAIGNASDSITVAIYSNAGGGTLSGVLAAQAVNGIATFPDLRLDRTGVNYSLYATAPSRSQAISAAFTVTAGAASTLDFVTSPADVAVASSMQQLTVRVRDAFGNAVSTATNSVTLQAHVNPSGASLGGTISVNAVAGTATFSGITVSAPSRDLRLVVTSAGLAADSSDAFNAYGPPVALEFVNGPGSGVRNALFAPSVEVIARDAAGNAAIGSSAPVTLSVSTNVNAASLLGTVTRNLSTGARVTFADVRLDSAGVGYRLTASSGGLTPAVSSTFDQAGFGAATQLRFAAQPTSADIDSLIAPPVRVEVLDAVFNRVTNSTATISLALGAVPSGATLGGTTSVAAVAGEAIFSTLRVNRAGSGATLTAASTGLTSALSSAFNLTNPGEPVRFVFQQQPVNTTAGSIIVPGVRACAVNSTGAVASTFSGNILLSVATGPSGGSLLGTTSVAAVSGCATFSSVNLRIAGTYTLTARNAGATLSGVSASFAISPAFASYLAVTNAPSFAIAGDEITTPITVEVRDQFGNRVTSAVNNVRLCTTFFATWTCYLPEGDLAGQTSAIAQSGIATFNGIRTRSTRHTFWSASSGSLVTYTGSLDGTAAIVVRPSTPVALRIDPYDPYTNLGSRVVRAREAFSGLRTYVVDSLGNNSDVWTSPVTIALGANPNGATLQGITTLAPTSGYLASFGGQVAIDRVGTGYTVIASSAGLTSGESQPFNAVAGAASNLRFSVQPSSAGAGGTISPSVTIALEDDLGNVVTTGGGTVTVAIANNPGGATLGGTLTVTLVNGVAVFPNLTLSTAGTGYTLRATTSVSGVTGTYVSAPFNITP